jgi:RNA polymerase sigma-70 factor (ECF subfamily)
VAIEDARFLALHDRFLPHVSAYCRRRASADEVEDAVADTFLTAWRKLDEIPAGDQALAWLYGVAYRVLAHQWRSASRRRRLSEKLASLGLTAANLPEDVVLMRQESRQLLTALASLRRSDQEILRLTAWEELSPEEIALVIGTGVGAVRQRLYQAKKKLAAEYNRLDQRRIASPAVRKGGVW